MEGEGGGVVVMGELTQQPTTKVKLYRNKKGSIPIEVDM